MCVGTRWPVRRSPIRSHPRWLEPRRCRGYPIALTNECDKGAQFNVMFQGLYRGDQGKWQSTGSFGRGDR